MRPNQTLGRVRRAVPQLFLALLLAVLLGAAGGRLRDAEATNAPAGEPTQDAAVAQAAMRPWTAVASTGAVDEISMPHFIFGTGIGSAPSAFGFNTTTQSVRLQARYNVTNTYDNNPNPNLPGWTTLELGAEAPGTSTVTAILHRIERCSAKADTLCIVTITNQPASGCKTCAFPVGSVDFMTFLYVVDVRITRPNTLTRPFAHTLRIY
jgi:hypothetical protein